MLNVFVDADACPVKQEVYRVAARYHVGVTLVANSCMRVPTEDGIVLQVVGNGLDEADNWIVANVTPHDIVVTADILLASRCIKAGAHAIGPTGKAFTEETSEMLSQPVTCLQSCVGTARSLGVRPPSPNATGQAFCRNWIR